MERDERGTVNLKLMRGAAILGIAAIVSKLLGTLQKVPLQNIGGDAVFGIYNAVYPLYTAILIVATAGVPIAVSKFVSEHVAMGNAREAVRILRISIAVLSISGIFSFAVLFFGADWIAALIGNSQTAAAIRSVSFALLIIPVLAPLRGFFQGMHNMIPTAVSQVAEQTARVAVMLGLLLFFIRNGYGEDWIAAGATFGSVVGAFVALLVMGGFWRSYLKTYPGSDMPAFSHEPAAKWVERFVFYSFPVSIGLLAMPLMQMADVFTVPRMLRLSGMSESEAIAQFGVYNRGLPLVQLVAMVAASISAALVPAIAEAKITWNWTEMKRRAEFSIRLAWVVGLAASAGLAAAAMPLNVMFYADANGSTTFAVLGWAAVFAALGIVTGSVLQGLGEEKAPAIHIAFAAILKIGLNLLLLPIWGITGAAVAAVVAFAAAAWLNLWRLRQIVQYSFSWRLWIVKPLIAAGIMMVGVILAIGAAELFAYSWLGMNLGRLGYTVISFAVVVAGIVIFSFALFRTGAVTKSDLAGLPKFQEKFLPLLLHLRLMKKEE